MSSVFARGTVRCLSAVLTILAGSGADRGRGGRSGGSQFVPLAAQLAAALVERPGVRMETGEADGAGTTLADILPTDHTRGGRDG